MKYLVLITIVALFTASCGDGAGSSSGADSTGTNSDTATKGAMSPDTATMRTDNTSTGDAGNITPPVNDTSNTLSVDSLKKRKKDRNQ